MDEGVNVVWWRIEGRVDANIVLWILSVITFAHLVFLPAGLRLALTYFGPYGAVPIFKDKDILNWV
jgi:hypothetical protein